MQRLLSLLLLLLAGSVIISCNQQEHLSPEILEQLNKAEQDMFDATANGDSATFRSLCGADYYTINANGEAHTLKETIPDVPKFKGGTAVLSEQKQRVYGDLVLRNGRAKIMVGGQQVAEVLYTTGWIYRDSRWQYVHWQGTMTGMMLAPLRDKAMMEP